MDANFVINLFLDLSETQKNDVFQIISAAKFGRQDIWQIRSRLSWLNAEDASKINGLLNSLHPPDFQ